MCGFYSLSGTRERKRESETTLGIHTLLPFMRRMVENEVSYSCIIFSQISMEENINDRALKKGKGRLFSRCNIQGFYFTEFYSPKFNWSLLERCSLYFPTFIRSSLIVSSYIVSNGIN